MTRIACHQLSPGIVQLDANLALATDAIRRSVASGARVTVLPELVTSGYMLESVEEARSVAIEQHHRIFGEWADAVAEIDGIVVAGFAELGDDGLIYNSAAVIGAKGMLAVYRKTHLWDAEKLIFTPGSEIPPVVDTTVGRIGVLICYDLEFPELTRSLALRGAELIAVPTNWPRESVPAGERVPEVTVAMAAAYSNWVAIACCDRSGSERGQDWNGASSIISERGWVVATADETGVAITDLDLTLSRVKKITPRTDALNDRRPELYGDVMGDSYRFD